MRIVRKIIEIDEEKCDGCGQCVPSCAEGAIQIVDGKARLVAEKYCDGLGACIGECPLGALKIVDRVAEDFDEDAVEHHLNVSEQAKEAAERSTSSCPFAQVQTFSPSKPALKADQPSRQPEAVSALSHWPVQIRLVPPTAPFLRGGGSSGACRLYPSGLSQASPGPSQGEGGHDGMPEI